MGKVGACSCTLILPKFACTYPTQPPTVLQSPFRARGYVAGGGLASGGVRRGQAVHRSSSQKVPRREEQGEKEKVTALANLGCGNSRHRFPSSLYARRYRCAARRILVHVLACPRCRRRHLVPSTRPASYAFILAPDQSCAVLRDLR